MLENYGARVLLLIRNGIADDWASLCRELRLNCSATEGTTLLGILNQLERAGLIIIEGGHKKGRSVINTKIRIGENWMRVQNALGISLADLVESEDGNAIVVKPYFGLPSEWGHETDLFVLMPFQASLKPVYEDHIVNVAKSLGLTVARGDDFFTARSVMSDIWAAIYSARAIIADCTGRNPNVFYEIGVAHSIGKPVILITQNKEDVPFDVGHIRYIHYEYTPRGMKDFEWVLTKTLQGELDLKEKRESNTTSILFLAADPTDASRLRLGEEFREIDEQLTLAKERDHFNLALPQLSLRPKDIAGALLIVQPQIVHFSGHGTSEGELCFETETGQVHFVQPDALAALFEQFANQVKCVLLNACYSEAQAKAIAEYIEYVIGMNQMIGDKTAIAFAIGFYQALGAGRSIEEAYKLGCVQIRLQGIPEHLTPVLIKKGRA